MEPTQGFLNSHTEMPPLTSSDAVFRFSEIGQPLLGKYAKPSRDVAPPRPPPPCRDLSEAEACSAVMDGQSLLVSGAPGTVKTYYVPELVKAQESKGSESISSLRPMPLSRTMERVLIQPTTMYV